MKHVVWALALLLSHLAAGAVHAQEAWVQIEAQPSLAEAEERARAYAGAFPNVQGYRLGSGWYGIVLGPFTPEEAARQIELLKRERLIPADSYIAEAASLGRRFWPAGVMPATDATAAVPEPAPLPEPPVPAGETIDEALLSEAALPGDARMDLQRAMQWFGVYQGQIDGSFGKGTRAAMADWQGRNGYEPTGILTTAQRTALIDGWAGERAALGIETIGEAEAGIEIDLPLGLVAFQGYEPPFVRYEEKAGSGFQVLLISRRGDARTLAALYDRLQALEIMPMAGERALGKASFTISGADGGRESYAQAELADGFVKGFVLVAPAGAAEKAARALDAMKASFTPLPGKALDETLGEPSLVSATDLTAGLDVRRPAISRTGVFIDGTGTVLTTTEVLDSCARLTLDRRHEATIAFRDDRLGIAVLTPAEMLAPRAFAEFGPAVPRAGTDVAVAGYSYEDRLDSPVMSFGTLAETTGLNGEADLARLAITTLAGDAGGAVLDASGAMAGLLLPKASGDGRDLPKDVGLALQAGAIAAALTEAGVALTPAPAAPAGSLAAEDLARRAREMTVMVSCWR